MTDDPDLAQSAGLPDETPDLALAEALAALPGEPLKAHTAFLDYVRMGSGRSLRKLGGWYAGGRQSDGETTAAPTTRRRTLETWSAKYGWQARLDAYQKDLDRQEQQLWEARRQRIRENDWDVCEQLREHVRQSLAQMPQFLKTTRQYVKGRNGDPDREVVTVQQDLTALLRAIEVTSKLQRLAAGMPDSAEAGVSPAGPETPARALAFRVDDISPAFLDVYDDIKEHLHTEYVLYGGRGSTKSSFISLILTWLLVNQASMHALVLRQVKDTLRDSVYSQLVWAISEHGLEDQFKCTTSPLEITYLPTGQKIYFRGADEPGKIKSIKPPFGYIGLLWFEELDQFRGAEAIRNIEQSAIRGGDVAYIFKSFNPPRTAANWANKYVQMPKANQLRHKSTYLDLKGRVRWLGQVFVDEAEHLQATNPGAYEHEYLGVANGSGGLVFENVQLRAITAEEMRQFDHVTDGLDFGFYPDPAAWDRLHFDAARRTLYVFDELHAFKHSNRALYDALVAKGLTPNDPIIADSAEPKSIADLRDYGANCRGAEKGPESVRYSMKWLQSLTAIVIDPTRCPETAREFLDYEYEQDKDGNWISEYPDANNHHIDAVRYGTNTIWRRKGQ